MRASSIPQWSLVSVLFSALSLGCMVDEDGDGDLEDRETPSGLSTITPSSIWAPVLNGQKVVAITAEENGEKTYYNFDYPSGTWWPNAGASFDDLSPTHPWMKLSLVGGMRPWGSDVNGNRVSGPMTAGYVYTDARGVDMFTFMNRDKYWVMCTANCATVNKNLLDELFSKSLDELAMSDPNHPWVRLRRLNGSHAWTGNGITAAFQHPDGRFFLFNDGEYWVLRTSAQGLYPEQEGARLVHDLTGGVMWRVSAAEALSPLNMYAESIVLLDGKRWVEFDQSFRPMGNEGSDVSNLMSCLRWREGCNAEPPPPAQPPAGAIDTADYVLLDCAGPSRATRLGSETIFTYPLGESNGMGRFLMMKGGDDGKGFEEWMFDDQWFYIAKDTTWTYANGSCDMECGVPSGCNHRWAGDPANFAFTVYFHPDDHGRPAQWLPRSIQVGFDQDYTSTVPARLGIEGRSYSSCETCTVSNGEYTDPDQTRWLRFKRHSNWKGFADALEVHVANGPGSGEHYVYGRGLGWIGFFHDGQPEGEWRVASQTGFGSSKTPSFECEGFSVASVCGRLGDVPPGDVPPGDDPPPPSGGCECKYGTTASGEPITNYCHYPVETAGCPMTHPGGYCDPNGDRDGMDADWVRGWNEYQAACG